MIYLGDKEVGIVVQGGGEPNFLPYLVTYVEQEYGTYEMQISNYTEEGQKVLIGSIINEDNSQNLYLMEGYKWTQIS